MLMRRIDHVHSKTYADLYEWLSPGELLADAPGRWADDWHAASADTFRRS
jgi:hypothetical protein